MTSRPEKGDRAPSLRLPVFPQGEIDISRPEGAARILYFYPRDNTPGCTRQAQDFTERLPDFSALNVDIIGISRDGLIKHGNFIDKYKLGIQLASDTDGQACEAFGVWVEKKMYGRTSMGIERSTFLILGDGMIGHVWRKVRVPDHVQSVLDLTTQLLSSGPAK